MQFIKIQTGLTINAAHVQEFSVQPIIENLLGKATRQWQDVTTGYTVRLITITEAIYSAGWFATEAEAESALDDCVKALAYGIVFDFSVYSKPEGVGE